MEAGLNRPASLDTGAFQADIDHPAVNSGGMIQKQKLAFLAHGDAAVCAPIRLRL